MTHTTKLLIGVAIILTLILRKLVVRAAAWVRRKLMHLLALVLAHAPALLVWRRFPRWLRRIVQPVLALLTWPFRWLARRFVMRRIGLFRVVVGKQQVRVALSDVTGSETTDQFAPPLRTAYAERLDSLEMWFVLGENRAAEVHAQRSILASVIAANSNRFDNAIRAASAGATAAVSSCDGQIDAVEGLIVPACTNAITAFLFDQTDPTAAQRNLGPQLFESLQMLLHRTFLNPASPDAVGDWRAEVTSRTVSVQLQNALNTAPPLAGNVSQLAPAMALSGGIRRSQALDTLIMLATALGPHVAWVTSYVVDELLRRSRQSGDRNPWGQAAVGSHVDDRRVRLVLEAMRHKPVVPGVIRQCPVHAELTGPNITRRPLRPGSTLVYTQSAEFTRLDHLRFRPDRFQHPQDAPPWMSFGYGVHECLGQELAMRMMVSIIDPLFVHDDVQRLSGSDGKMSNQLPTGHPLSQSGGWPFPTHLGVRFTPGLSA